MFEPNTAALSQGCDTTLKNVIGAGRSCVRAPIAALAVAASLGLGAYASNAAAQAAPANAPQGAAATFQKQAADLGIKSCANLFATLGDSLTRGTTYASNASTQKDAPNDHAAQALVGMRYDTPNYKGQSAGVIFTSPTKTGCEGGLVRVAPFPQSCPDVVKQLPQGSTLATTLSGTPLYNLGGNQGQALLVPSGNSCVVVTVANAMDRR
ncbi:hypothetical protein B551_0217800 [Cupriavidus sp. HPC(L)]|uniref:hypothetical protein n=1 Tax=Cupriavidus sp. HPC(L) TaxID=1217418 RepID=UPI0002918C53|nr:hypothetical protein [Cupriavidus sp. HPC(L)]ESJ04717.1 hypothetical protein B551_0217800 [Cupriavidus sp. HPC(L)]